MKKTLILLLSVVLVMNIFVACGNTSNSGDDILASDEIAVDDDIQAVEDDEPITEEVEAESESTEQSSVDTEAAEWDGSYEIMPEPFETANESGGDENYTFYMTTDMKLGSISAKICAYVGWDEFKEWINNYTSSGGVYTSVGEAANLYSCIKYFDIPDEKVREVLVARRNGSDDDFSDEEIDLLLSGDDVAVAEHFASDTAIRKEDNLYSLCWVYEHSIEDYIEAGITTDDISGVLAAYDEVGLTSAAKSAITAKLNDYINGNYEVAE